MKNHVLFSKVCNAIRYRGIPHLNKLVSRLQSKLYTDLGRKENGPLAPKALLLFPTDFMGFYIQGRTREGYSTKMHNIYFRGLAMLDQLVKTGYVVDVVEKDKFDFTTDTSQYSLIIDEGNTLPFLKNYSQQHKIFYSTGLKWDRWNRNELDRIQWFYNEHGLMMPAVRQVAPQFSDEFADSIFYKGIPEEMQDFSKKAQLQQLAMPVDFVPDTVERDYSKREFVWIGGGGSIFKGLDIVIGVFADLPHCKLNIFGPVDKEPLVYQWMMSRIASCPNIEYHGYADYSTDQFQKVIKNCVAHIYPSAGENGCATVGQTCHFGLIPVITRTANNQAITLGRVIEGNSRKQLIASINEAVEDIMLMSDRQVKRTSDEIMRYANERFTRPAFVKSISQLFQNLELKKHQLSILPAEHKLAI